MFARFRIGTGTQVDNPTGFASLGEVEDYRIQVMGIDQGDAPSATYGQAVSYVFGDANGDNVPDDPSAIWLGYLAQGKDGNSGCLSVCNNYATGDDNDGVNDEDGYVVPNVFKSGNTTISFIANGNTHGQIGYYGIWIDWNRDGFSNTPEEFYSGSFAVGSPVTVNQLITVPASVSPTSLIYMRFRVGARPLIYSDYSSSLINSETEDYFLNNSILPVTLTSFSAVKQGNDDVLLKWQTASEQNNRGFNVQHSNKREYMANHSFVSGSGNSNNPVDYSYVHSKPLPGIHYYRLQQMDLDNKMKTSAIRKVNINSKGADAIIIYPNPVKDKLRILQTGSGANADMELYSSTGSLVLVQANVQNGDVVNIQKIPAGVYILKLNYPNQPPVFKKIIKE